MFLPLSLVGGLVWCLPVFRRNVFFPLSVMNSKVAGYTEAILKKPDTEPTILKLKWNPSRLMVIVVHTKTWHNLIKWSPMVTICLAWVISSPSPSESVIGNLYTLWPFSLSHSYRYTTCDHCNIVSFNPEAGGCTSEALILTCQAAAQCHN